MKKPFVKVTWHDAEDIDTGGRAWMPEEEVDDFKEHHCVIVSAGFLVSKTDKYVTLAADWIDESRFYGRVTKIPTGMVVRIEKLK